MPKTNVSAVDALNAEIKALEVDLNYASARAREYGNMKYGGTKADREKFYQWNDEAKRVQRQITDLQNKIQKHTKADGTGGGNDDDTPLF